MSAILFEAVARDWEMRETFTTSRGPANSQPVVQVRIGDAAGNQGRGEASGVDYHGETPATMLEQLEGCRLAVERGATRQDIRHLLPAGGARNALDCAFWDLEAQRAGKSLLADLQLPILTAYTIGIRSLEDYEATARRVSDYRLLKVKVDGTDPLETIDAVRRGAPGARLIVDPNQAWSVDQLKQLVAPLAQRNVVLLEQPIAVGTEAGLRGWRSPIPLCADELVSTTDDIAAVVGLFDMVNIKLDKAGGLTESLRMADAAQQHGLRLMVGCMAGSSLAMAPALLVAARCEFVDLDGPLLQCEDVSPGLVYQNGWITKIPDGLWGGRCS